MEPSEDEEGNLAPRVEAAALNDCQSPGDSNRQRNTSPTDILRIKDQMANQCFEMKAKLLAGKSKRLCSTSEAERGLPDYISELEDARTNHFNKSLALHRMQMWNAVAEKLTEHDSEFGVLKVLNDRCMAFCSHIQTLQQESRKLEDKITEIQKQRLELKRLTHEKMKEIDELMNKEHPDVEKYKAALQKGQSNLEKYKKMAVMTQQVLRGILLACKVNWLDDPRVRAIAMTLEELPISD